MEELMSKLFETLSFSHGPGMKNRFMLAPLTNSQSRPDGILTDDEYKWLTMRAEGGFGLTMTCAVHVQAQGQGFPCQLGAYSDDHIEGLARLAEGIRAHDSVSICQIHHGGMRSLSDLTGETPVCPSDNEETGARAMTTAEVEQLVGDFISGALRCQKAGFDGIEIHGAHGYIVSQFLSAEINLRDDQYGGSLENRSRVLTEIIDGIREQCGPDFMLGVRLSPERFGIELPDAISVAQTIMSSGKIDFLDMSLWDVFKEPAEEEYQGRSLMSYFTELDRNGVRLGVAGQIRTPEDAEKALAAGADWVMLGRAAIIHHDFPNQYLQNPDFTPVELPVTEEHLKKEGLTDKFISYLNKGWSGFVATDQE
jgi:2,4-dienoyl-CoA reductase-like NADH-dependent reductase (Old Yellow Enzyme family)|tara:strand:- start:7615 stop:8715 length:1101 start_codon:yes stop_codon:yes gene_type:complete